MRWKTVLVGLALTFAAAAGCKQQCFVTECDLNHYRNDLGLPPNLAGNPEAAVIPTLGGGPPATVDAPERKPRYMTLHECIALALEQGTVSAGTTGGIVDDSLVAFAGATLAQGGNPIRVLALNPALSGADIETSLSKFDAQWVTSMIWQRNETPVGGNLITSFNNGDLASFTSSLLKPLPTGGVAGITFNTSYTLLNTPPAGFLNPTYRPSLQFQFEQPLLQGFGVEINQLRGVHPGSVLTPFSTGLPVEGILITRIRFDEQRAEFERQVNYLVVNVEAAYWNLYGSYWALYSREQALRQAYETWKINKQRFEVGRISRQDLAQSRQQYETFRGQRITALGVILEDERQLRLLLGLEPEDGTRLVPIDTPTLAPYQPDWETAVNDAMVLRPELVLARQDLKFRQLDLINNQNLLMPDLRFFSTYSLNGIGSHVDGGEDDPNNAFHSLATNDFHSWELGLRLTVPIGFRAPHAAVRQARLRLSQSYVTLREAEKRARSFLGLQYRQLFEFYAQIQAQRAVREAAAIQLEARLKEYLAGRIILDVLLTAQTSWADALQAEYAAIVNYNNALARFEFGKGTILEHDNVVIAEGLLPHCAQVRAVEHERQRALGLVVRERATPVSVPPCCYANGSPGLPQLPAFAAPSLPSLYEGTAASPDVAAKPAAPKPVVDRPSQAPVPQAGEPQRPATLPDALPAGPPATPAKGAGREAESTGPPTSPYSPAGTVYISRGQDTADSPANGATLQFSEQH